STVLMGTSFQEQNLKEVYKFLTTLETPLFSSISAKKHFLKKAVRFFVQNGKMYKRLQGRPPLLVVFDPEKRATVLNQAHEELGHRGEAATWETVQLRFFWPYLFSDV
ncbi:hypothetical protein BDR05DRAFT_880075, partial [Suillus weaverae]